MLFRSAIKKQTKTKSKSKSFVSCQVSHSTGFFTEFDRVLPSFFYLVLPTRAVFDWVQPGFIEFYWVLPGFTRFYWFLLSFTD